jgi:predicted nucleotidyltransferase
MKNNPTSKQILHTLRNELPHLKKQYNVESMSLFGSYSKNKQTPESDIDILVTFSQTPGLIKFVQLENYLSDKLGSRVDLVMKDALKKNIGHHINEEAVTV